jgi:uncharacterized protein YxeA
MDYSGRKNYKGMILAIVIIAMIILAIIGGYFFYKNSDTKKSNQAFVTGYSTGYNQSLRDVSQGQSQTGTILVWENNSIQVKSIQDICNGVW